MAFKTYKFRDINELELHLNGAIFGGPLAAGINGLEGKTLIFTRPSVGTCTFVAPSNGASHTLADIKSELEAAIAGLQVSAKDGKLVLQQATPVAGEGVEITGGTARTSLGWGGAATLRGRVYSCPDGAAAPTAPYYVNTLMDGAMVVLLAVE